MIRSGVNTNRITHRCRDNLRASQGWEHSRRNPTKNFNTRANIVHPFCKSNHGRLPSELWKTWS